MGLPVDDGRHDLLECACHQTSRSARGYDAYDVSESDIALAFLLGARKSPSNPLTTIYFASGSFPRLRSRGSIEAKPGGHLMAARGDFRGSIEAGPLRARPNRICTFP